MYKPDEEDNVIIYDHSVTLARLLKQIEDVKKYAEYIINYPAGGGIYESGKQVAAQMILKKLNQIKVEGV